MVAEMLATLCWTAPATMGLSSPSTYSFVSWSMISSSALSSRLDSDATDQFVDPIMRYGCAYSSFAWELPKPTFRLSVRSYRA